MILIVVVLDLHIVRLLCCLNFTSFSGLCPCIDERTLAPLRTSASLHFVVTLFVCKQ